jgi:hypothetical protein
MGAVRCSPSKARAIHPVEAGEEDGKLSSANPMDTSIIIVEPALVVMSVSNDN